MSILTSPVSGASQQKRPERIFDASLTRDYYDFPGNFIVT
jgi:hypothetical protein